MRSTIRLLYISFTALILAGACLTLPGIAFAQATVLIDAIPSGAQIVNFGSLQVPFQDLNQIEAAKVEAGITGFLEQTQKLAAQQSATYICLLSAPGDDAKEYHPGGSDTALKLNRTHPNLSVVMYRGGSESPARMTFRVGSSKDEPHVTFTIKKISVPQGWNSALWLFFNLSRLQSDAVRSGASEIYLTVTGTGPTSTIALPGMIEPLTIFDGEMTFSASWKTSYPPAETSAH